MINKIILLTYFEILSEYDANPCLTLVNFVLNPTKRNIVNFVNEQAKKDKKLADLLQDAKYSNNKEELINNYLSSRTEESESLVDLSESMKNEYGSLRVFNRQFVNSYGFVSLAGLGAIVGFVALILTVVISLGTK